MNIINNNRKPTALELATVLAKKGDLQACVRLVRFYQNYAKDKKLAFSYIKQIADSDSELTAKYAEIAGNCLVDSTGCKKDLDQAFEYYNKSVNKGNTSKALALAMKYYFGLHQEKNETEVFNLYKNLNIDFKEESNYSPNYVGLADCYYYGVGTEVNEELALKNYIDALKNMLTQSIYNMSVTFDFNDEIEENFIDEVEKLDKLIRDFIDQNEDKFNFKNNEKSRDKEKEDLLLSAFKKEYRFIHCELKDSYDKNGNPKNVPLNERRYKEIKHEYFKATNGNELTANLMCSNYYSIEKDKDKKYKKCCEIIFNKISNLIKKSLDSNSFDEYKGIQNEANNLFSSLQKYFVFDKNSEELNGLVEN